MANIILILNKNVLIALSAVVIVHFNYFLQKLTSFLSIPLIQKNNSSTKMSSPSKEGFSPSTVPNQRCPGPPNPLYSCLQSNRLSTRQCLFLVAFCFSFVLLVALLAGKSHLRHRITSNVADEYQRFQFHRQMPTEESIDPDEIREAIFMTIDPGRIASTLRMVTQKPHQAGTVENRKVAEQIAELWRQNGLEKVRLVEYDVLLSYPNWTSPNHIAVLGKDGDVQFQSTGISPDLIPPNGGGDNLRAAIQWLAYSANGTVESEPIYCHYGRPEDFERLEKEFGIVDLKGKIAIIRYGQDFRGDKVKHAEMRGAGAAILFSDPIEVAGQGADEECTFPHSTWLPPNGVQRGSVMNLKGDPLSPLLPARSDFFRGKTSDQAKRERLIPTIPVLPLGFADVKQILGRMGGPKVPKEWQGGINVEYRIGPGFGENEAKGGKLRVEVKSNLQIKTIQNVVGLIRGADEPDSWVLLGNHFDAWVYGAIDPNSGTSILGEVARAFTEAMKTKRWRPKRTLVFCAWDAEEYGLIGSTEFVQEFADLLRDRAVVYLNVDLISHNQSLDVRTVPSLYQAVTDAAKFVQNPVKSEREKGRQTIFDTWKMHYPPKSSWLQEIPKMNLPGGGSDHMSFLNFLGIPVVDFTYRNASWNSYPLYHSRYEIPFANEHLFDHDNLAVHKAVGQYWAELARSFADSPLLPINATIFAQKLLIDYLGQTKKSIIELHSKYPFEMEAPLQQISNLEKQSQLFLQQSRNFDLHLAISGGPEFGNRRLRKIDQCFINPAMGLAENEPEKRHVLFSISDDDTYSVSVMAAVGQKINELAKEGDADKRMELGRQLALQLTVVQYSVLCATNTLKPFI